MRRPGADTKVGGFPFTTIGFKLPVELLLDEGEGVAAGLSGSLRGGCGRRGKLRQVVIISSYRYTGESLQESSECAYPKASLSTRFELQEDDVVLPGRHDRLITSAMHSVPPTR